jgi:hypothetical protein
MLARSSTGFLIVFFVTTSFFHSVPHAQDLLATEILKKVAETYCQVSEWHWTHISHASLVPKFTVKFASRTSR